MHFQYDFYMTKFPQNVRILGPFCQDFVRIVRIFWSVMAVDTLIQWYPKILLDLVPKTLCRFFSSLLSGHVSHQYSKKGRSNDLKTLIFVPLHKYPQRHTPLCSESITPQEEGLSSQMSP